MNLNFSLNTPPLAMTLGGISWISPLRKAYVEPTMTVVMRDSPSVYEKKAALVGQLEDYGLYFLTSRSRVRLTASAQYNGQEFYIVCDRNDGLLTARFRLQTDPVGSTSAYTVDAVLRVTPELEILLQGVEENQSEIVCVDLPPDALFANALCFRFGDGRSLSLNITPALLNYIEIEPGGIDHDYFIKSLNFRIHYIGQSTGKVEDRLNKHEKIRQMADVLLTKELDQEPLIFTFTHSCVQTIDAQLSLDVLEAALIGHFRPPLNIEHRGFPLSTSPKEINLAGRIREAGITCISIADIELLSTASDKSNTLTQGVPFTWDEWRSQSIHISLAGV